MERLVISGGGDAWERVPCGATTPTLLVPMYASATRPDGAGLVTVGASRLGGGGSEKEREEARRLAPPIGCSPLAQDFF